MPGPYNYSFDKATNSYIFITKNNILYRVAFFSDETLNTSTNSEDFNNLYQIIIEKISSELEAFDERVSKTIDHLISDFFSIQFNALIYVCTDTDNKGMIRFEIFDRWYRQSSSKKHINKIDNIISYSFDGKTEEIQSALLYHNENPQKEVLIEAYKNIGEVLNEAK